MASRRLVFGVLIGLALCALLLRPGLQFGISRYCQSLKRKHCNRRRDGKQQQVAYPVVTNMTLGEYGRLGNQMFQIALLMEVSHRSGRPFVLPPCDWKYNQYMAHPFDTWSEKVALRGSDPEDGYENRSDGQRYELPNESDFVDYQEHNHGYTAIDLQRMDPNKHWNFMGNFESLNYFRRHAKQVRKAFQLSDKYRALVDDKYEMYLRSMPGTAHLSRPNVTVGMHVRRGDLANGDIKGMARTLSVDFYRRALQLLLPPGPRDHVLVIVCSDDIEWCKANLTAETLGLTHSNVYSVSRTNAVFYSDFTKDIFDLYLLSRCPSLVMAPSTFSWWAAFLGNTQNVVTPAKWYKRHWASRLTLDLNTRDLLLPHWQILEN